MLFSTVAMVFGVAPAGSRRYSDNLDALHCPLAASDRGQAVSDNLNQNVFVHIFRQHRLVGAITGNVSRQYVRFDVVRKSTPSANHTH